MMSVGGIIKKTMSDVKTHVIQGAAAAVVLYPFFGGDALLVGVSMVAIDVDHAIEYYHATRKLTLSGIYQLRDLGLAHLDEVIGLNIFHTLESHFVLFLLAKLVSPKFGFVLAGFALHHVFDQIYLARLGYPFARALSIVEYFVRYRHRTTMKQLANRNSL